MDLDTRTGARLTRWRRLSEFVSGSLGVAAVCAAVYLGATGPIVSPVAPVQAVAAAEPATVDAPAVDAPAADPARTTVDIGGGPRFDDGGRGDRRPGTAGSGHHR